MKLVNRIIQCKKKHGALCRQLANIIVGKTTARASGTLSCVVYSSRNFISFDKTSILNISETLKMAREFAIQASF